MTFLKRFLCEGGVVSQPRHDQHEGWRRRDLRVYALISGAPLRPSPSLTNCDVPSNRRATLGAGYESHC